MDKLQLEELEPNPKDSEVITITLTLKKRNELLEKLREHYRKMAEDFGP